MLLTFLLYYLINLDDKLDFLKYLTPFKYYDAALLLKNGLNPVFVALSAVVAGEGPYLAVVDNDINANPFYLSPKYLQFAFCQDEFWVPVCDLTGPFIIPGPYRNYGQGCEQFRSQTPVNQPEICDTTGVILGGGGFSFFGEPNARVTAGNSGWFEWYVRLPKKPNGVINLCIQCGKCAFVCPHAVIRMKVYEPGLLAGAPEGWGIAVVAGTGCNCWGRDRDHHRIGRMTGMGWQMGEAAGAGELVEEAIRFLARER